MYSLISFATQWGSKHGGINSFNADFLTAFGVAYHHSAQVVCIVASATHEEINEACSAHVTLLPLPYQPEGKLFTSAQAQVGIDELRKCGVNFDPDRTVWLGHDRITGAAANEAVKIAGGRSALIHHMSYSHYESYAENSLTAYEKTQAQTALFQEANLVLAIGPLLRDALIDILNKSKTVQMLIPGQADIETHEPPQTFTAFLSGRFSDDAARIKQSHLGVAAFSRAHFEARESGMPESLRKSPKLVLRGVDFETQLAKSLPQQAAAGPEAELKKFAEEYAHGVINLQALPYTHDRQNLYADLSGSSVALMPSWHEGFGLAAWEAIAAGVPVIISKNSGVYRLLEDEFHGAGTGCVYAIEVAGAMEPPFFREEDLGCVVGELKKVAINVYKARRQAGILKDMVGKYSWSACAEQASKIFDWPLQKWSIPIAIPTSATTAPNISPAPIVQPVLSAHWSPLYMPLKQWQSGGVLADSQLLRAEEALVPFDGARQPELDLLNTWLDDTRWPQAVRLITGAGGLGKTRLALELCQQRLDANWHAGFLDTDFDTKDMVANWRALQSFNLPLLIVIDYAETRQATLLALIKAIAKSTGNQLVRLLLLARDGGEWWDNLPGKDPICEPLLSGYATSGPFCLPPLHEAEQDRQQAYSKALHTFAQAIGTNAPNVVPDLSGEHFGRPLYLQMAALLALHGERPITAQGLTKALLNHERRYWRRLFPGSTSADSERHAELLLALTTLAGGFFTPRLAVGYWAKASGDVISNADFSHLFHTLVPLYPGKQGLQAVRPDLLGEALVAQALLRPEASCLLDAVLSSSASQSLRRNALTVLARLSGQHHELHETLVEALVRHFAHCCQDIVVVSVENQSHLPALAEAAFARLPFAIKSQIVGLLDPLLSDESVQLAELSCLVREYIKGKCSRKLDEKKGNVKLSADYAMALRSYAVSLMCVGRNEEARAHAFESTQVFGWLVQRTPDQYESDYAIALGSYANRLSEAGQYGEALTHSRQDLEIHQRLVQTDADRYAHGFATSLNHYANHLSHVGRWGDALTYAKRALENHQLLAQKNPDWYEPDCALALGNYANRLNEAGQYDEALKQARQVLEIYQRLVQKKPDRYEPDYARSLSNYAGHLSVAGQYDEVLKQARQALEIRQRLVQKNPDRYEPDYAESLNNYANRLSEAGQYDEALRQAMQALEIHQGLVRMNADRHDPNYVIALNSYADRLSEVGQYDEAHTYVKCAMEICERLVQKNTTRFAKDLFGIVCSVHFLGWLADKNDDLTNLSLIPTAIPVHLRPILLFYKAFVEACRASGRTDRAEAFKQVIANWCDLPLEKRVIAQPYWLCTVAWCATFEPSVVEQLDWLSSFHQYAKQRQGRLPRWMQELAKRMAFEWPT